MSKMIEVKQSPVLPSAGTPDGLYEYAGMIYVCHSGLVMASFSALLFEMEERVAPSAAVSESLLLKAIAVTQRPELAKDLA